MQNFLGHISYNYYAEFKTACGAGRTVGKDWIKHYQHAFLIYETLGTFYSSVLE